MLKDVLFTHTDLDGVGCAIVYKLWWKCCGDYAEGIDYLVVYCSNSGVDDNVKKTLEREDVDGETRFLFTDIVCSREVLERIADRSTVIDHHATNAWAEDVAADGVVMTADGTGRLRCGASLLYDYFTENLFEDLGKFRDVYKDGVLNDFVRCVEDYDTFRFKENGNMVAKYMQVLFGMLGIDRFVSRYVNYFYNNGTELITANDMDFVLAKVESEQRYIDNLTPDSFKYIRWGKYNCALIINPMANVGEIGYQYLAKHPEIDAIISASLNFGEPTFQFRGYKEDVNTALSFAVPLGGGGHVKASGAPIKSNLMHAIYLEICKYIALQDDTELVVDSPYIVVPDEEMR